MILEKLQEKFEKLKKENHSEEKIVIALKEELQHYILYFLYNNKKYSDFVMYGGTVLRIGYGLPRMSEDLDFQTNKEIDQKVLGEEIEQFFEKTYNFKAEVKVDKRDRGTKMLFVKFDNVLDFETFPKTKIFVRIDINFFEKTQTFFKNTIPVFRDDLVYTINTYPLATLMASKSVAFLTRQSRYLGKKFSQVKPRDLFDMIWYLDQKIVPDFRYLEEKGLKFKDFFEFKTSLEKKAENINEDIFKEDLEQFFFDINELETFLTNWKPKFQDLLNSYEPLEAKKIQSIYLHTDLDTDLKTIVYKFENGVKFKVRLSEFWISLKDKAFKKSFRKEEIGEKVSKHREKKVTEEELEYIGLFFEKIQKFLKENNNVVFQKEFQTKKILTISKNVDFRNEVVLTKEGLEKISFENLL